MKTSFRIIILSLLFSTVNYGSAPVSITPLDPTPSSIAQAHGKATVTLKHKTNPSQHKVCLPAMEKEFQFNRIDEIALAFLDKHTPIKIKPRKI